MYCRTHFVHLIGSALMSVRELCCHILPVQAPQSLLLRCWQVDSSLCIHMERSRNATLVRSKSHSTFLNIYTHYIQTEGKHAEANCTPSPCGRAPSLPPRTLTTASICKSSIMQQPKNAPTAVASLFPSSSSTGSHKNVLLVICSS